MDNTPHNQEKSIKRQSFELVYKRAALPLTKFLVKRMGGDQQAAEEVFAQTMVAAWKGWHTFEHKSSYFTWICRIALNKAADYYRDQVNQRSKLIAPTLETLASFKDDGLLPEERVALLELRQSVKECLMLLPDEKRQLLYLRYWQDLTVKNIADLMGISERAAEGKLYRARYAFREIVQERKPELVDYID